MKRALPLLTEIAQKDPNVFLLTGDLGYHLFDDFFAQCPDQFVNCGIMEQNMIGVAAGLALEGTTVFVYSIATFASLRCLEQIRDDVCYTNANVKILSAGAGFNYGNLGFTHHSINDLACLLSLPINVYNPGDVNEAKSCLLQSYREIGPSYTRIGRSSAENGLVLPEVPQNVDNGILVCQGKSICLLSSGPLLNEAKQLAEFFGATLYSFPSPSKLPAAKIQEFAQQYDYFVTIEESSVVGGFGSVISQIVASTNRKVKVLNIGIPVVADYTIGDHEYLKDHFGLSVRKMKERIEDFIRE